jgi:alkylation response protein AidB-like acyl-CoA dehydrogenase
MDLSYGEKIEAFRRELRAFLAGWPLRGEEARLTPVQQARLFRQRGIERGYVFRNVPVEFGGSGQTPDPLLDVVIREEYGAAGAPGDLFHQGPAMLVPTLLDLGSEEQKRRFIPPTLREEIRWCQGYSEPGSGSDLASLQSTATLEGDHWVLRGHKIWTSNAHESQWMFGLFRSEPNASKHAGISYLLVPLDQPGITVRPLKQLTGGMDFNEVFLDGARTEARNLVGKRGEGWQVSRATLKHERNLIGNPRMMRAHFEAVVGLAKRSERRGRPAIEDAAIRSRLAVLEGYVRSAETSSLRVLSATTRGREAEVIRPMLMAKLFATDIGLRMNALAYDLLAGEGLLAGTGPEVGGTYDFRDSVRSWVQNYLFSLGPSIAGGASNVQRNIIGERVLGLPRDR